MKAVIFNAYGDADQLAVVADRAPPEPIAGEITIDVAFAGVGFVDILVRSGALPFAKPPMTPGIEVSGTVRAIGAGVTGFETGQRVAALLTDFTDGGMGGYAEVVRAKAALTVPLVADDDLAHAAATIANGATAVMAIEGVVPGTTVAISGASGGLGQRLIAAAARAGAGRIVAISGSADRAATLRQLGATEVVSRADFAAGDEAIDAAFDTAGGPLRRHLARRLQPGGRLVLLGNASGDDAALSGDDIWLRALRVEGFTTAGVSTLTPDRVAAAARAAIADTRVRPTAFALLDLDRAADAHRMVERGEGPGKIVLKVA